MSAPQVIQGGADDAQKIHTLVIIKTIVFGGQDGANQLRRHFRELDRDAPLVPVLGD